MQKISFLEYLKVKSKPSGLKQDLVQLLLALHKSSSSLNLSCINLIEIEREPPMYDSIIPYKNNNTVFVTLTKDLYRSSKVKLLDRCLFFYIDGEGNGYTCFEEKEGYVFVLDAMRDFIRWHSSKIKTDQSTAFNSAQNFTAIS